MTAMALRARKPSYLGIQIRKKRQALGLSQARLAEMSGVNRQQVIRIENGNQQDLYGDAVARVARSLGTSADELLGLKSESMTGVVDRYLRSPLAVYDCPTKDEVAWMRGLSPAVWHGEIAPNERAVHELLAWHRRLFR